MKYNQAGHSKTKRGNTYNLSSTKKATGYSKVLADCRTLHTYPLGWQRKEQRDALTRLAVLGTFDSLAHSLNMDKKTVITRNPMTGRETRKKVISERGLRKLNKLREARRARQ